MGFVKEFGAEANLGAGSRRQDAKERVASGHQMQMKFQPVAPLAGVGGTLLFSVFGVHVFQCGREKQGKVLHWKGKTRRQMQKNTGGALFGGKVEHGPCLEGRGRGNLVEATPARAQNNMGWIIEPERKVIHEKASSLGAMQLNAARQNLQAISEFVGRRQGCNRLSRGGIIAPKSSADSRNRALKPPFIAPVFAIAVFQ